MSRAAPPCGFSRQQLLSNSGMLVDSSTQRCRAQYTDPQDESIKTCHFLVADHLTATLPPPPSSSPLAAYPALMVWPHVSDDPVFASALPTPVTVSDMFLNDFGGTDRSTILASNVVAVGTPVHFTLGLDTIMFLRRRVSSQSTDLDDSSRNTAAFNIIQTVSNIIYSQNRLSGSSVDQTKIDITAQYPNEPSLIVCEIKGSDGQMNAAVTELQAKFRYLDHYVGIVPSITGIAIAGNSWRFGRMTAGIGENSSVFTVVNTYDTSTLAGALDVVRACINVGHWCWYIHQHHPPRQFGSMNFNTTVQRSTIAGIARKMRITCQYVMKEYTGFTALQEGRMRAFYSSTHDPTDNNNHFLENAIRITGGVGAAAASAVAAAAAVAGGGGGGGRGGHATSGGRGGRRGHARGGRGGAGAAKAAGAAVAAFAAAAAAAGGGGGGGGGGGVGGPLTLHLAPVGSTTPPSTNAECRKALYCILKAASRAHALGYVIIDIRWPNVIRYQNCYYVIDAAEFAIQFPLNTNLPVNARAPSVVYPAWLQGAHGVNGVNVEPALDLFMIQTMFAPHHNELTNSDAAGAAFVTVLTTINTASTADALLNHAFFTTNAV